MHRYPLVRRLIIGAGSSRVPPTNWQRRMRTIILLTISNTFMNLAWYGHLKFRDQPLWLVILASWGLAFFEYLFQVPANRIGINEWTLPQLKVLQECITLVIFTGIAFVLFRSPIRWNIGAAYLCIVGAVYFAFFTR